MNRTERRNLLSSWVGPASDSEKQRQERAERMVRNAITSWSAFDGVDYSIYTKGSYPNNTNVRSDSDVDVVVENQECIYFDYEPGVTANPTLATSPYQGPWTPTRWRAEVTKALEEAFGEYAVNKSGKIAINVAEVEGSRPSADVVPSFNYYLYMDADRRDARHGSCVFNTGSTKIVNWPEQQLSNGQGKNSDSGRRYKQYVRALKRAENALAEMGSIEELPSYFMECLVFNVANDTLRSGDLDDGFRATLVELWGGLQDGGASNDWVEPNWMKYLFRGVQKWTVQEARELVLATWGYLDYGS